MYVAYVMLYVSCNACLGIEDVVKGDITENENWRR